MHVKLLTSSVLMTAAVAARQCTDSTELLSQQDAEAKNSLLKKCLDAGHLSIFEHINYTFSIQDVSRALLQELARHSRRISISVKSTRWALQKLKQDDVQDFQASMCACASPHLKETRDLIDASSAILNKIIELRKKGVPNDILKYFIPEGLNTGMIMTVNARELMHIFTLRTSKRALAEFRYLCCLLHNEISKDTRGTHDFLYDACTDWDKLKEEFS